MRRMFSENQITSIIQQAINNGQIDLVSSLIGKYVKIMEAPESTTLTDEQIAQINKGVFINGTFLSLKNPVLFPSKEDATSYSGLYIASEEVGLYYITKSTKEIVKLSSTLRRIEIKSVGFLNGKEIPAYPSNTGTFVLKCIDGVLTWVEEV